MDLPYSKTIRYIMSALVPYCAIRYFFPELTEQKELDNKPVPPTLPKMFLKRTMENRAFKIALLSLVATVIWDDSASSLVNILSGSSPALSPSLFSETATSNTTSTIQKIIQLNSELKAAGVAQETVEQLNRKFLPNSLRFQFILVGLKRSIKRLFKLSNGNVRLFWLALILWLANSCLGFSAILFAIRELIREGELPPNILDP